MEKVMALQSETHEDELGVVFVEKEDGVYCAIDFHGGEMLFKLNFIEIPYEKKKIKISEKKKMVLQMKKDGYSVRQIMRKLGYKSTASVTHHFEK